MTTAKNDILLGHNLQIVIYWGKLTFGGGNKNLVGESTVGGFFQVGGMSKFLTGRGTPLIPPPNRGNLASGSTCNNAHICIFNLLEKCFSFFLFILHHSHLCLSHRLTVLTVSHFYPVKLIFFKNI